MSSAARVPLTIAAVVVALQALVFLGLALGDLTGLAPDRVGLGLGIALVLVLLGAGLLAAAVGLVRSRHAARGPVVVTQLIGLGLAWSLRSPDANAGDNRAVAIAIAVSAVVVLACLASRPAREALADRPAEGGPDEPV